MPILPITLFTFSLTRVIEISLIFSFSFREKIYSAIGRAKLVLTKTSDSKIADGGFLSSVGGGMKKAMSILTVSHL